MRTKSFIEGYTNWLRENSTEKQIEDNIVNITIPFIDKNNDWIELLIIENDDKSLTITDDGHIVNDLESSGFNFKKNVEKINEIINSCNVYIDVNKNIFTIVNSEDYPEKLNMLIQSLIKISDLV